MDGSTAAARVLTLVNPAGVTKARNLAEAPNGGIISGDPKDVSFLRVEKANDFSVAASAGNEIRRDLGQAFLMTTSIQRNGERVTAEEIKRMANELEMGLGGNYSTLSIEYQLPQVKLNMYAMQKQKRLPELPPEVQPTILTGIQALGRNADLERELTFIETIGRLPVAQEEIQLALKAQGAIRRIATHLDIETRGLVNSPEEIEAIKKQQQEAMMAKAVAPQLVQAVAGQANQTPPVGQGAA